MRPNRVNAETNGPELPVMSKMRILIVFLLWCLLLVICWPLALLALLLFPILWLIALPFRFLGAAVGGLLALVKALFLLPARLLGYKAKS